VKRIKGNAVPIGIPFQRLTQFDAANFELTVNGEVRKLTEKGVGRYDDVLCSNMNPACEARWRY
jgi:hypothetical protein